MSDAPAPPAAPSPGSSASVVRNAKRIAVITLISRIFGLVRDMALAAWLGNSWVQDRFTYGFMIPNLFRRLFGEGALAAAFVPTLSASLHQTGPDEGKRVYAAVATLLAAVLAAITLVVEVGLLAALLLGPDDPSFRLAVGLTAVMLPFMPFICQTALMGSCLNVLGRFAWPAAMPIVMNIIQIAAIGTFLWVLPSTPADQPRQVYILGGAVVLSGIAQVVVLGRQLAKLGYRWRPVWQPGHPAVQMVLRTMAPAILGLGVLQVEPLIDGQIILWLSAAGSQTTVTIAGHTLPCPLREGTQSSVAQAQRLYQFPLGVLAISLATAVFPALARHAAAGDFGALRSEVGRSVRLAIFEGLPAGLGLLILAEPITALLLQHGNFTPEDTRATAWVLRFYCVGLWAFCVQQMLTRAFYALHDTRTPLKVSLVTVACNVALNLVLVWTPLGAGTFGLTTAVTTSVSVLAMGWLLRQRLDGALGLRAIVGSAGKTLVATSLMALAAGATLHLGHDWWAGVLGGPGGLAGRTPLLVRLADVLVPMLAGGTAFLAAAALLRCEELRLIVRGR